MTNDDKPLDLEDQPFAKDLDAPIAAPTPTPEAAPVAEAPTEPVAAEEPVDDGWGDDPVAGPGAGTEPGRSVADEWVRPSGQSSSLLLLMGAIVLVMVGVVVFLAINGNDDEKAADPPAAGAPEGTAAAPAGDPGAAPPETTPDPGTDPDLDAAGAQTDDFEREDATGLGSLPGGGPWTNQVGTIAIEKGVARTVEVDPASGLQLATVDVGATDVVAEVRLPSPVDRAGIAFRVVSPDRFIGLFATSDYGTYTLARFENGTLDEDNIIGNTDLSGVSTGDVIGIRATGSTVEVLTNGTVRNSFDDEKLVIDGTSVGLFAFLDDTGPEPIDARDFANWDDFKVLPG